MNLFRCLASAALVALILTSFAVPNSHAEVTVDWVTVGNLGNANDIVNTGTNPNYGAVGYEYRIGKYEVTIQQYTDFLNAVAKSDPYSLYNANMGSDLNIAGISRSGTSGEYTYSVIAPSGTTPAGASSPGNRPITYVSWFDAARFANWMNNGQGSGSTETGAYSMSAGQITAASRTGGVNTYTLAAPTTLSVGDQVAVTGLVGTAFNVSGIVTSVSSLQFTLSNTGSNAVATGTGSMTGASATAASNAEFYIPTENEWYKAAFYSPVLNSGSGGYYSYATQSNTAPGNIIGSDANQANYRSGDRIAGTAFYAVTQSTTQSLTQNYLTDVGAFTESASHYGTFDQTGNVWEFTQDIVDSYPYNPNLPGAARVLRGGTWYDFGISSDKSRFAWRPDSESDSVGFRLASPVAVPEPSTYAMALAGIACGGFSMWWRRKRT